MISQPHYFMYSICQVKFVYNQQVMNNSCSPSSFCEKKKPDEKLICMAFIWTLCTRTRALCKYLLFRFWSRVLVRMILESHLPIGFLEVLLSEIVGVKSQVIWRYCHKMQYQLLGKKMSQNAVPVIY